MVGSVQVHNRRESVALDMKAYSHLSAQERIRIDELRNREGLGVCQIALRIGRDKSTVSREPGRGPWFASDENESYRPYRPKRLKAVFRQIEVDVFGTYSNTVGVQLEHRRRLVPCFVVCLVYFMRECLFR